MFILNILLIQGAAAGTGGSAAGTGGQADAHDAQDAQDAQDGQDAQAAASSKVKAFHVKRCFLGIISSCQVFELTRLNRILTSL